MGWVVGALLAITGSIASNLGVNIQKYSFIRQTQRPLSQRTTHWKDFYWLSGLGLVIFGSLGDFAALSMVAQSIVAPLASTTLVTNVLFAHFWLHETVGRRELAGTALIIIGSTLAVVFGDHETRTYSNDMLVSLIGGAWFLVYAIVVAGMCVVGLMLHRKITPIKAALVEAIRRYEVAVDANDAQACDDEDAVIAGLEALYAPWIKIHPFALCALSGAFGAQSVLFGKCFAELLSTTMQGDNQLWNFFPWVALICMGATVASQLHFLAVALNYFDALYAVPVFQCFFIGVSTLGGALYFREVYSMTAGEAVAFVIGLLMTLGGVAVLSTRKMSGRTRSAAATGTQRVGLAGETILEGDEEQPEWTDGRDFGQEHLLLAPTSAKKHRRRASNSSLSLRASPAASPASVERTKKAVEARSYEMSDIPSRRTIPQPSQALPVLRDSARLPGFAEQAAREGAELADLKATIGDSQDALAAKLAAAGYGAGAGAASASAGAAAAAAPSPSASLEGQLPLLSHVGQPGGSNVISPALAIQIEADQAYINRAEDLAGAPGSAARKRRASAAAARYDSKIEILKSVDHVGQLSPGSMPVIGGVMGRAGSQALGGVSGGSSRSGSFNEGSPGSGSGSAPTPSHAYALANLTDGSIGMGRAETPRSAYVQSRERSGSFSSRTSPAHSGANTPVHLGRRMSRVGFGLEGDSPVGGGASGSSSLEPSPASSSGHPGHARMSSQASPLSQLPSAMFSGATLESAQELPDVEKDTRLQRLTRLSVVGHWVSGLHAQMPVVGGVAQAILQAKEMQIALDQMAQEAEAEKKAQSAAEDGGDDDDDDDAQEEDEEEEREGQQGDGRDVRVDMPVAEAALPPAIELADFKATGGAAADKAPSSDKKPAAAAAATAQSASASASAAATSDSAASGSAATAAPSAAPATSPVVKRTIEFDDDYDPFSTQAGGAKLSHRDPFQASLNDTNFLPSPTSAFAELRAKAPAAAASGAGASASVVEGSVDPKEIERAAEARAKELVQFSPLSLTSQHPLQAAAQPSASASPAPAAVSPVIASPSDSPPTVVADLGAASTAVASSPAQSGLTATPVADDDSLAAAISSASGAADLPVEEWAAALRIQSLYRGQLIRRQLRSTRHSLATGLTGDELAALVAEGGGTIQPVDPTLPAPAPSPHHADPAVADPAVVDEQSLEAPQEEPMATSAPDAELDELLDIGDAAPATVLPDEEETADADDEELNLM